MLRKKIVPHFETAAADVGASIALQSPENLKIIYPTAAAAGGYLRDHVLVEFGGRNLTEPAKTHSVEPEIAPQYAQIAFVAAEPVVLDLRRTFWEKVTAIHKFVNHPDKPIGNREARHWYDVYCILESEHREAALSAHDVLRSVVEHKKTFFYAAYANYDACLKGEFNLLPEDTSALEADYKAMLDAGMFYDTPPEFEVLIERVGTLIDEFEPFDKAEDANESDS